MAKLTHDGQSSERFIAHSVIKQCVRSTLDRPLDSARTPERTLLAEGPSRYYNRMIGFKILPYFLGGFLWVFFTENHPPLQQ